VRKPAFLALLAFFVLGLPDGMLGPAWPTIRADLGQPLAALGELTALGTAGIAVSSLLSGRVRPLLGAGGYLTAGAAGCTLALILFAGSPWWAGLLAASFALGVAAAAIDTGFNSHVALHYGPRLMNALHASYGVGATLGPLLIAAVLTTGSWRLGWAIVAAVELCLTVMLFLGRGGFPAELPARWRTAEQTAQPRRRALPLLLALFFFAVGIEAAIGAWSPTLLEHRGYSHGAASAWTSSYWAAFTAGRAGLAFAGRRIAPARTIRISAVLALAGVILLQWTPVGLPLAGLGLAGLFPALVSLTPLRVGADRAATAMGYQLAAGTIGATAIVGMAGVAAQVVGIGVLVPYFIVGAVALVAIELVAAR
jgi:fucose permease